MIYRVYFSSALFLFSIPILIIVHFMKRINAIVEIISRNGKPNEKS